VSGLRFVYLLGLVVWLGGMLVLGTVAAPVLFEVLQSRLSGQGRVLAGESFGTILARFHLVSFACAAIMSVSLAIMAIIGPRPRPFAPRLMLIGVMALVAVVVAFPIGYRIQALQASAIGPIAALPDTDARKVEFGRLHGYSNGLLMFNAIGGLVLVFWEAREHR
jgi:hypothetical protein